MWLTVFILGGSIVDQGIFQNHAGPKSIWGGCSFQWIQGVLLNGVYVLCSARGCLWIRFFSMWGEVNVSLCMFKAQS